ncbi:MAG: hypothetical protein VYD19_09150, partial [Myxococcota bacterium]|nr:hypothetical protein [Myxococcota bacterium]
MSARAAVLYALIRLRSLLAALPCLSLISCEPLPPLATVELSGRLWAARGDEGVPLLAVNLSPWRTKKPLETVLSGRTGAFAFSPLQLRGDYFLSAQRLGHAPLLGLLSAQSPHIPSQLGPQHIDLHPLT